MKVSQKMDLINTIIMLFNLFNNIIFIQIKINFASA